MIMTSNFPGLPLGYSSFESLRESGRIYVDKTQLVYKLCTESGNKIFLARPRRFGKSLLVSTFESLFKNGTRSFKGLAIEQLWEKQKSRDVVRLDFSELVGGFHSLEEFRRLMRTRVIDRFGRAGFSPDAAKPDVLAQFASWLSDRPVDSLVVLIDEYDAPLTYCLHDKELFEKIQQEMMNFYFIIKSNSGCLHFLFITGVSRFSHTGIFSGFNDLTDVSLSPDYGTLLGYTEEEIEVFFAPYLKRAQQVLGLDADALLSGLRENYDGFCFDMMASTHVYCPWSVLRFLLEPMLGFRNYWYQTGGQPSVLVNYLKIHALNDPRRFDQEFTLGLDQFQQSLEYSKLSVDVMLAQAGYFTIRSATETDVTLGYPNREVRSSMARLYARELFEQAGTGEFAFNDLQEALKSGDLDAVVKDFNAAFNMLDSLSFSSANENTCRALLKIFLIGRAAGQVESEKQYGKGRSDLEVVTAGRHWVFELKYARSSNEIPRLLEAGARQMKENRYGIGLGSETLLRAVLVFDGQKRQFAAWKLLEDADKDCA